MIDIKFPIGLMFTILGALLLTYGFITFSDAEVYRKAAGMNINLWSGSGMLIFGIIMLICSKGRIANK
jgi:multisubunit Na+/H+ antiporter MnhG subunit